MAASGRTLKKSVISPTGLAIAYRAIGISQAHWAEMTYEASERTEIQAKLGRTFRDPSPQSSKTPETETSSLLECSRQDQRLEECY
jgi:hypothetical protein